MSKLLGKIERFDARGNKRMLPRVTFRVKQFDFDYSGDEISFVWLGHAEPTPAEWRRIANERVRPHLVRTFGEAHADKLLLSLEYPHAEAVG